MRRFVGIASLKQWIGSSLLCFSIVAGAQNIPVGTWRTHFSYQNARLLERTSEKVFCAAENGIFSIDLTDGSLRKLSKIDGLSDVGVSAMRYDDVEEVLIIGYRSGLVDFVYRDRIETVTEIANSNLEGNKQINDIETNGSLTYLATDLGIVVVNTESAVVRESFVQIGVDGAEVEAKELTFLGDQLFVKTENEVQSGSISTNLLDFNNWSSYGGTSSLENLINVDETLYAQGDESLFTFLDNSWEDTGIDLPTGARGLYSTGSSLTTLSDQAIYQLTGNAFESVRSYQGEDPNDVEMVEDIFWIADGELGLISESNEKLSPAGPKQDQYNRIKVVGGNLYGFHAPDVSTFSGSEQVTGYSIFEEGGWSIQEIEGFENISDVASFQNQLYFGSIGDGFFDFSGGTILNEFPSSNTGFNLDTLVSSLYTRGEFLWVSSYGNVDPIHRFNGESWDSFSANQLNQSQFIKIRISEIGTAWFQTINGSLTTFRSDDLTVNNINIGDGLPGQVTDFEISIEDDIWIVTDEGPATFSDASLILQNDEAVLPTLEGRVLFEGENVNSVSTDGGNRVWFGTDRGLWLFDENVSEQIAFFDQENSPLPSNRILKLAYNGNNGEMFVLTDKGLMSYRSASSNGSTRHRAVSIFPNPVRPEFTGLVGLDGLAKNVTVKVTDINGNLVQELQASGGSASWNLRNLRNTEVVTGIYLFFSATSDGEETYVGKIAVVR